MTRPARAASSPQRLSLSAQPALCTLCAAERPRVAGLPQARAAWEMAGSTDWQADGVDETYGFAFEVR